jgi:hypothetical protein
MQKPKRLIFVLAFVAALAIAFAARTLYYYRGVYRAPDVPQSTPPGVESLADPFETTADLDSEGITVLFDTAHENSFDEDELTVLTGRMASNGAQVEMVRSEDDLADGLHSADALVVLVPNDSFSAGEVLDIQQFIDKGGRLILAGDPTRQRDAEALNSLAGSFGVVYQDDYVYNLTNNDGSYRNVIFADFAEDVPLTEGLEQVVFQTASSIRVEEDAGLIFGDKETYSSRREQPGDVIAAALTGDGRVLMLPDVTFLTSPYNTFADNDILLDNIVTFALTGERDFTLVDYPYFFDAPTQLVYEDAVTLNNTFADLVTLRSHLAKRGIEASLADEIDTEGAFVYLALYEQANEDIIELLEDQGITLSDDPLSEEDDAPPSEGSITIEDVAQLEKGGTVLLHLVRIAEDEEDADNESEKPDEDEDLDEEENGGEENSEEENGEEATAGLYQVIILAASEEDLSTGIDVLLSDMTSECLVTPLTAVCQTGEVEEEEEEEEEEKEGVEVGGILVVSDDQGLSGASGGTSAGIIADLLDSLDYDASVYSIQDDGPPELDDLLDYDMVFWSTGDYCCQSPNKEGAALLMEYLDIGGRLFIDGLFIATDWEGSDFLEDYLGAEFSGFGIQVDLAPGPDEHPLSEGFEDAIPFVEQDEGAALPDLIQALSGVDVVFVRGPESERSGEPSLVAYEEDSRRVAYAAFPLFLLEESDLMQLLDNAVNWLAP